MNRRVLVLITAAAGVLSAQTPAPDPAGAKQRTMMWEHKVGVAGAPQEATIGFMAVDDAVGMAGSPIKGAPYSATVEHVFTQTLADGTRIERKSSSKTARDSEGRVRTEQSPTSVGPVPVDLPTMVFIHDPVGKQTIVLNDKEKTARVMKLPDIEVLRGKIAAGMPAGGVRMRRAGPPEGGGLAPAIREDVIIERKATVQGEGPKTIPDGVAFPASDVMFTAAVPPPGASVNQRVMVFRSDDNSKSESLGTQSVSGVNCAAKRNTHTIPAGQIGNDRPIEVVTETCFSEELKTVLSSRTNDPMHGETSMRLSGVSRGEPAKSLFEIPAGYTVKEGPQPMMFERRIDTK